VNPLMASRNKSKQEAYAENLEGDMGLPLYQPLPLRANVSEGGHVGDIAFFKKDGSYQWVSNAFCSAV